MKNLFTLLLLISSISFVANAQYDSAADYCKEADKLINKQKYKEALDVLEAGIEEMPDSSRIYDMRGVLLDAAGLFDLAIADFEKAIQLEDDMAIKIHILSNLGGTKTKIRDFKGAYEILKHTHDLSPNDIAVLNNLAVVCDEIGKPEETRTYLNKIILLDPKNYPAHLNIGFSFQTIEKHDSAIVYFDKAIKINNKEPFSYSNRSYSKLKLGDIEGAMKDIDKSIELNPYNSYAFKIKALILIENKKTNDACIQLNKAVELGYEQQYGAEVNELIYQYCK